MILKIYFKVYYLPYSRIFFHITIPRNLTYSPQATCITAYTCRQSPWIPIKEKCILPIPCYIWYITEYYFKFLFHAFNAQICWSKRYFYLIATEMAVFYLCFFYSTIKQSPETTIFDIKHAYIYRTDALDFCYNKPIIYILALYFCPHILWPISQQSIFSMENVLVSSNKDWVWGSCVNLIDAQNLEPLVKTSARK